jgi:hypothetical protein
MTKSSRIAAVERATGRSWDDWLDYFNRIGASTLTHHEIATTVLAELDGKVDNPGWWAQSTAVAYEQHTGRRVPGQRPDGTFQTSVSRSTSLGMTELMDAWTSFAATDKDVLGLIEGDVRVSGTQNRISWRTKARDGANVVVISEPKKNGTASLVVQHIGCPTYDDSQQARHAWTAIVDRFTANR